MPTGGSVGVLATEIERVNDKIPVLFEREDTFYSQIEKRPSVEISEMSMRMPLEIHPNGDSGGYSSDGGDMGLGDMPDYDKATLNVVELIHRMQWTERRKFATDSSRKAVVNAFRRDLANSMKEFRRFNDSLCMTAGNGVMGTITTANNVGGAGGTDTYTLTTDGFGARLLRYKQKINIYDPTLTNIRNPANYAGEPKISFIDGPNKTIQVTNSPGAGVVQVGDLIVPDGVPSWTPPPSWILGVPYHASNATTGTWLGFNRATTPEIRANRVQAGGALSLSMARLALNKAGDRLGANNMKRRMTAWMHPAQAAAYEEIAQEAMIINKDAKEQDIDMYFSDNMRLAGAPVRTHYSWDKTRIDFIDLDLYGRAEFYEPQWFKDENTNKYFMMRGASGGLAAAEIAYIIAAWQLYVSNPAGIAYIDGLSVPAGY